MTDVLLDDDEKSLMRAEGVDDHGVPMLLSEKQQMRYARMWLDNGVVSRNSFKNALQVLTGIQAVKALGLQPMTALRQTAFVNGQFIVFGNIPDAIVQRSGAREWKKEFCYVVDEKTGQYVERSFENSNLHLPVRGAVCVMKRVNEIEPYVGSFSVEDATLAGLWKKSGPWTTYPQLMLMYRARTLCIQKGFSDITHCVATESDVENVPEQIANQKLRERLEKAEAARLHAQSKMQARPFVDATLEGPADDASGDATSSELSEKTSEDKADDDEKLKKSYDEAVKKFATDEGELADA